MKRKKKDLYLIAHGNECLLSLSVWLASRTAAQWRLVSFASLETGKNIGLISLLSNNALFLHNIVCRDNGFSTLQQWCQCWNTRLGRDLVRKERKVQRKQWTWKKRETESYHKNRPLWWCCCCCCCWPGTAITCLPHSHACTDIGFDKWMVQWCACVLPKESRGEKEEYIVSCLLPVSCLLHSNGACYKAALQCNSSLGRRVQQWNWFITGMTWALVAFSIR